MNEEEIIKYLENVIKTIKESDMLFDEPANIRCGLKMEGAIQGLLDLYKEKNKQIQVEIEGRNILVGLNENLKEELKKEKEKNKILELAKIPYLEGEIMAYKENDAVQRKMLNDAFDRGWIHTDKVREFALSESQADTYNFKTISLDRLLKFLEEK